MPATKKRGRPPKAKPAVVYTDDTDDEMDVDAPASSNILKDVAKFATTHPYATSALGAGAGIVLLSKLNQAGILSANNVFGALDAINPTLGQATRGIVDSAQGWLIAPAIANSEDVRARAAENFELVGQTQAAHEVSLDFIRRYLVNMHGQEAVDEWWAQHVAGM